MASIAMGMGRLQESLDAETRATVQRDSSTLQASADEIVERYKVLYAF